MKPHRNIIKLNAAAKALLHPALLQPGTAQPGTAEPGRLMKLRGEHLFALLLFQLLFAGRAWMARQLQNFGTGFQYELHILELLRSQVFFPRHLVFAGENLSLGRRHA